MSTVDPYYVDSLLLPLELKSFMCCTETTWDMSCFPELKKNVEREIEGSHELQEKYWATVGPKFSSKFVWESTWHVNSLNKQRTI